MWAVQECKASLALVVVLGEKEKVAPALAVGAVRVGGAGTGAIYLDGSVGEKEKASPALAEGGSACGRGRSVGHQLPWWQCRKDRIDR